MKRVMILMGVLAHWQHRRIVGMRKGCGVWAVIRSVAHRLSMSVSYDIARSDASDGGNAIAPSGTLGVASGTGAKLTCASSCDGVPFAMLTHYLRVRCFTLFLITNREVLMLLIFCFVAPWYLNPQTAAFCKMLRTEDDRLDGSGHHM